MWDENQDGNSNHNNPVRCEVSPSYISPGSGSDPPHSSNPSSPLPLHPLACTDISVLRGLVPSLDGAMATPRLERRKNLSPTPTSAMTTMVGMQLESLDAAIGRENEGVGCSSQCPTSIRTTSRITACELDVHRPHAKPKPDKPCSPAFLFPFACLADATNETAQGVDHPKEVCGSLIKGCKCGGEWEGRSGKYWAFGSDGG